VVICSAQLEHVEVRGRAEELEQVVAERHRRQYSPADAATTAFHPLLVQRCSERSKYCVVQ